MPPLKGRAFVIRNEKEFNAAMRRMIRRVQSGELLIDPANPETAEVLAECIRNGYLNGTIMAEDPETGRMVENRTADGKIHPRLYNTLVPKAGLAFLHSEKLNIRVNWALAVSFGAILVSMLANLDKIYYNLLHLLRFLGLR